MHALLLQRHDNRCPNSEQIQMSKSEVNWGSWAYNSRWTDDSKNLFWVICYTITDSWPLPVPARFVHHIDADVVSHDVCWVVVPSKSTRTHWPTSGSSSSLTSGSSMVCCGVMGSSSVWVAWLVDLDIQEVTISEGSSSNIAFWAGWFHTVQPVYFGNGKHSLPLLFKECLVLHYIFLGYECNMNPRILRSCMLWILLSISDDCSSMAYSFPHGSLDGANKSIQSTFAMWGGEKIPHQGDNIFLLPSM